MKSIESAIGQLSLLGIVLGLSSLAQAQPQTIATARATFARQFETRLLAMGIPAHVTLAGEDNTMLRVQSSKLTPQKVFKVVSSRAVSEQAKQIGFKEIVFSSGAAKSCRGCGQEWDYNIQRESMTWLPSPGASSKGPITRSPFQQVKYSYARLQGEPGMSTTKSAVPTL
jgi:hypothetical protein